jgi:hypothetical protein
MKDEVYEGLIKILRQLFDEAHSPFPYEGCRFLLKSGNSDYQHFVFDLDLYFSELAGYSSLGKKILKWSDEKVADVKNKLSKTFFEKHPEYKPLEEIISKNSTPDLYDQLELYENIRQTLMKLLYILASGRTD